MKQCSSAAGQGGNRTSPTCGQDKTRFRHKTGPTTSELKRSMMAEDLSICGDNISKAQKALVVHHESYNTFSEKKSVHTLIQ